MAKGKKKEKKEVKKEEKVMDENQRAFRNEVKVLFVVVLAIIFLLSFAGKAGVIGTILSNLSFGFFGLLAYALPFFGVIAVAFYIANRSNNLAKKKLVCVCIMVVLLIAFVQLVTYHFDGTFNVMVFFTKSAQSRAGGGVVGGLIGSILAFAFGEWGAYVILIALMAVGFMFLTEKFIFQNIRRKSSKAYKKAKERAAIVAQERAAERARLEELEALEDWEQEEIKPRKKAKFFSFKSELPPKKTNEKKDTASGMEEIVADEQEKDKQENADANGVEEIQEDPLKFLTIQRGDTEKETVWSEQTQEEEPVETGEQQELTFAETEDTEAIKETEELPIYQMEIDKKFEEESEGVVMDALEQEDASALPENAIMQLNKPIVTEKKTDLGKKTGASDKQNLQGDSEVLQELVVEEAEPVKEYQFPTADLLNKPEREDAGRSDEELKENARKLQSTLESFGVGAKVVNVSCGPAVTRFELQPDQGVKVSKITALADDIKLNMAAEEIRIEAPIPGKAAVGIEVPNETTSMVHLRDLVENKKFLGHSSNIAFAVGKDISGQVVVTDIAKMPHLLIAGATGSGKSVCINTLIMSILFKAHPDDVKLIMIDPKVVELSCYNGIPHLLIPVVTDPKKASGALQWAVQEMSTRYKKFAELCVRDLKGYNEKVKAVEYANDPRYKKMPQIVIIVDELADLMMVASKEVEDAICRLAQLARACGIHLVIATQRPSVNVITGVIKANVPSRIAFAVSSAIDSRTILDGGGAEKLLGKGDMLFYPSGFPKPVRVQGAFVSDEEVNRIVEFLAQQNVTAYDTKMDEQIATANISDGTAEAGGKSDKDDYFTEAGRFIIEKDKASIGMLQRVYKIGFNRAARIMDQLFAAGVVGPEEGTKPRKVLMTMEEFDEYISQEMV